MRSASDSFQLGPIQPPDWMLIRPLADEAPASGEAADARAIGLETGVQSYALVIAIVQLSFGEESCVGRSVFSFVAISSIWYVISSFGIAIALCCFHTPYLQGDKEA